MPLSNVCVGVSVMVSRLHNGKRRDIFLFSCSYAGYERVYIYDNYLYEWERVDTYPPIAQAIASGFAVYVNWHDEAAKNWDYKQKKARDRFMYKVWPD